jgi:hypothetical protein
MAVFLTFYEFINFESNTSGRAGGLTDEPLKAANNF